jgi:hypothetical protein
MKTLGEWLIHFGLAKTLADAQHLCYSGSVRLGGTICTQVNHVPLDNTTITSVNSDYLFLTRTTHEPSRFYGPCAENE